MNALHMIVWIVGIVMVAQVVERYLRMKSENKQATELDEDTAGRIDELEQRIRVLERIVTENRVDLKKQIDDL